MSSENTNTNAEAQKAAKAEKKPCNKFSTVWNKAKPKQANTTGGTE